MTNRLLWRGTYIYIEILKEKKINVKTHDNIKKKIFLIKFYIICNIFTYYCISLIENFNEIN